MSAGVYRQGFEPLGVVTATDGNKFFQGFGSVDPLYSPRPNQPRKIAELGLEDRRFSRRTRRAREFFYERPQLAPTNQGSHPIEG